MGYGAGMKPIGFIWVGIGIAVLGVLFLLLIHGDDGLQDAMNAAAEANGDEPSQSDTVGNLIGLGILAVAGVLVLIGAIGLGTRAGRRED